MNKQPVFGLLDCLKLRADQFHVVAIKNAGIGQVDREIQGRLPAYRRQQSELSRALPEHRGLNADDLFNILARERLDIRAIGQFGIGHDGGRV